MEPAGEDIESLLCAPARRTHDRWVFLALFVALAAIAVPAYLHALAAARALAEDGLCAAVPEFRVDSPGVLHVALARGGASLASLPVTAEAVVPDGRFAVEGAFDANGGATVVLPLVGIGPGKVDLLVRVGESHAFAHAAIEPMELAQLRTSVAAAADAYAIGAVVTRIRQSSPSQVVFRLYSPTGQLLACENLPAAGAAAFDHRLARTAPRGVYTLEAETPAHRLTQPIAISAEGIRTPAPWQVRGDGTCARVGLLPEAGVLVAGMENRVRVESDPEAGIAFPANIAVEGGGSYRVAASGETFGLPVPAQAASMTLRVDAKDARGAAVSEKVTLAASGALLVRPEKTELAPGEALALRLETPDRETRLAVAEVLAGRVVIASALAALENGRGDVRLELRSPLPGELAVRAYPLSPRGAARMTWAAINVRPTEKPSLALDARLPDKVAVTNRASQAITALALSSGDQPPVTARVDPAGVPARVLTPPAAAGAEAIDRAHFWRGVFVLAAALLLLQSFAELLASLKRPGLFWFLGIAAALYLLTTCSCRLFGALVVAAAVFFVQRSFAPSFRVLPPLGRLSFRWAVPTLCLVPYIHFAMPLVAAPRTDEVPYARCATAADGAQEAAPALGPGTSQEHALPGAGAFVFAYGVREDEVLEIASLARPHEEDLRVQCALPASMSAGTKGDVIAVPIVFANDTNADWSGTFALEGLRINCEPPQGPLAVPAHGKATMIVTVTAVKPGAAVLAIAWEGTTRGGVRREIDVHAAGESRAETVNGVTGLAKLVDGARSMTGHANPCTFTLPQRTLYGSPRLSARVFPGPASQMLALLDAAERYPWLQAEKDIASAHAACLFLACLRRTGESSEVERAVRTRLTNALLGVETALGPDGGARGGGARVALTSQALLLYADLAELWQSSAPQRRAARQFLLSQVRADGTYRSGEWERALSAADVATTCLVACALREATPAPTRLLLRDLALGADDGAALAPLCAACLLSGALGEEELRNVLARCAGCISPQPAYDAEASAWLAYALALALDGSGPRLTAAKQALALLSLARDGNGAFPTPLANQLALRALLLCTRTGSRLEENDIAFLVNTGTRSVHVAPDVPDSPLAIDCTEFLRMEENEIRVDGAGPGATPYQVLFSYALPWEGRTPSPQLDVNVRAPAGPLAIGARATIAIDVRNLLAQPIDGAYIELRVPPLLRLEPARTTFVSGSTQPGATALLVVPPVAASGTRSLEVPVTAVAAGRAYIQPCAAFLAPNGERAHSEPALIEVER